MMTCHEGRRGCITEREMMIVGLHGQLGMASDWNGVVYKMSEFGHEMRSVDLWSYLESRDVGLGEFGKELNEGEADGQVLMGYSMGGRLALHALVDDPGRWKMAVIVSAHGGLDDSDKAGRRAVDDEWSKKVRGMGWGEFLSEWNGQGVLGNDVMPDRMGLESRREEIARSFGCWSLAEQEIILDKLAGIQIPVLFVVGGNDEKFVSQWRGVEDVMPMAECVEITGVGHRVPWEAEDKFVGVITEWMSRCGDDDEY